MKKLVPLSLFLLMIATTKADILQQADSYKTYSQQLDAIPRNEGCYKAVEIFTNKNVIAILCLCDLDRGYEMRLFCFDGNSWSSSRKPWKPPIQEWHFITVSNILQVYSINNSAEEAVISFYPLDETNKLSETPSKVLSFKTNEKYFPNETHRNYLRVVAIDPNELFIIGNYTEFRLNPISFLSAVLSGGHGLTSDRLFGMRVRDNTILGQYNIPEWIENNDYAVLKSVIVTSQNIFIGWLKGRQYALIEPSKFMCAQYDLTENRWEKPMELFRKNVDGSDGPFLAIDGNNVLHSVWSYVKFHNTKQTTIYEGSGVFYRSGYKTLTKTQTLSDTANLASKIIADKNGNIHIFMAQENFWGTFSETPDSGLFHLQPGKIGATLLISEPRMGSFDVAVSDNNDIHVVLVKATEKPRNAVLEYVKIVKQ
ncbi:MAG: hypothetical protein ABSA64_00855 [Sedimentisphaerales bacterium]